MSTLYNPSRSRLPDSSNFNSVPYTAGVNLVVRNLVVQTNQAVSRLYTSQNFSPTPTVAKVGGGRPLWFFCFVLLLLLCSCSVQPPHPLDYARAAQQEIMDAEAFLAAQLWLRPLPDEAWPPALPATTHGEQGGRNPNPKPAAAAAGAAAGAGAGARADESCDRRICGVVILAKARCCFLLENRPSGPAAGVSRGNSGGSSGGGDRVGGGRGTDNVYTSGTRGDGLRSRRRPRPLLFSTRSSSAAAGVVAAANETPACYNSSGKDNHRGTGDNRSTQASGGNPQEVERGQGTLKGRSSCDGFQRSDGGTVRVAGGSDRHQERRPPTAMATATAMPPATHDAAAPVQLKREFDFGLAIAREPPPPLGRTGSNAAGGVVRESGRTETSGTRAEEGRGTCHPRTEDQGGGGGGGGFLLLRIEGKVYEAEHTLIRSIAYPRGGGGGGGGRQEESRRNTSPSTGAAAATATDTPAVVVAAASRRGLEGGGVEGARGPSAPGGVATTAPPLLPAREPPTLTAASSPSSVADAATTAVPVAVPGAMPVPGAGQKKRRTNGASNGDDGAAGANDVGFGGVGDHGGVTEITHEERPEGVGKRSRVDNQVHATGAVGGGGCGGLTVAAAAAAAEKKEAQERSHEGDDGVEAGMPFCGLFFPGVMIKFWVREALGFSTDHTGRFSQAAAAFAVAIVAKGQCTSE